MNMTTHILDEFSVNVCVTLAKLQNSFMDKWGTVFDDILQKVQLTLRYKRVHIS